MTLSIWEIIITNKIIITMRTKFEQEKKADLNQKHPSIFSELDTVKQWTCECDGIVVTPD